MCLLMLPKSSRNSEHFPYWGQLCLYPAVTFNGAGPKPSTEPLGETITQSRKRRRPIKTGKKKWVDDLSLYVPIRLQDMLIHDSREQQISPAQYHNRTGQMLAEQQNEMQSELDSLNEYCRLSKMSINQEKSKCMLFNRSRKHDSMPELYLNRGRKQDQGDLCRSPEV